MQRAIDNATKVSRLKFRSKVGEHCNSAPTRKMCGVPRTLRVFSQGDISCFTRFDSWAEQVLSCPTQDKHLYEGGH